MFSGITNQFTNLLGKTGAEGAEQAGEAGAETAAPAAENVATAADTAEAGGEGAEGAAKAGGVFSGVSSKVGGWLSNAPSMPAMPAMPNISMPNMPSMPSVSIPGLRKTQTQDESAGVANEGLEGVQPTERTEGADDDDRSRPHESATGGADSRPLSPTQLEADAEAGGVGNVIKSKGLSLFKNFQKEVSQVDVNEVTTKVTAGAKSFGSFLFSAATKVGDKVKESVVHNPILDKFNKEQDAFIKSQGGGASGGLPWEGHQAADKIKEEILALSADRRNFVRAPPAGIEYEFNYDQSYPVALAIMNEDKQLEQMRFELVPKIITEENFWRNYFYRVSLIVEAGDLGTLGSENEFTKRASSDEDPKDKIEPKVPEKDSNKEISSAKQTNANKRDTSANNSKKKDKKAKRVSESEFVSDTLQTNEADLDEVKEGMKKLGIDSLAKQALETNKNEEQWEKDLEAELQDYEVVNDGNDKVNWEKDVEELLEEEDLK
ncbi:synapse-associated protein of 47 kDa isoform X2 [Culicoides brevitarsis]|uniref:synapse-associated protein of 47 kDa isoform X2 n=1 Tax=Culicoides brevitarsis TaxID=469753 RepID=UPI00307B3C15